jgi:hypothetical protein
VTQQDERLDGVVEVPDQAANDPELGMSQVDWTGIDGSLDKRQHLASLRVIAERARRSGVADPLEMQ